MSTDCQKFFSVRELKIKCISYTKGHYGWKSLNKIQKERHEEDSKGHKVHKQKMPGGMGMGNKQIFLFTMCYNPVASKLEATQRQG